jgi:hypothetical protein
MKRFFTISFFLVILLFAGFMELYAQEHINSYNVWAMAVMEKGQEQPAILMYTSPVETAENGLEYHRIVDENWIIRNESYNPIKLQYGYRMADKKIFIYDFENKKETLAFDFNISEGDHFTTFNGMEWEVVAVNDTTVDTTGPYAFGGSVSSKKLLTVKTLDGKLSDQWLEDFGSFANHLMIRSLENVEYSQTLWMEYDMGEYVAREINADPFFTHDTGWMISDDGFHEGAYTKCNFENGNVIFEDVSLYPWEHRAYSVFYRKGDDIYRISMLEFEPQMDGNSALRKDVTTFKGLPAPVSGKYTVHLGNSSYTTGITGVSKVSQQKNNSYDLQGRAVNSPTNGIYINNGRKAIVK